MSLRAATLTSLFSSLVNNDIDVYPEYDGSLLYEHLHRAMDGPLHDSLMPVEPVKASKCGAAAMRQRCEDRKRRRSGGSWSFDTGISLPSALRK